jgi:hypothetical protein
MSVDSCRRKVQSHQQAIARLLSEKGRETQRVADLQKRSSRAMSSASRTKNVSALNSFNREAQRCAEQAAAAQNNVARIEGKIAQEQSRLANALRSLASEEAREADQQRKESDRLAREQERRMKVVNSTIQYHNTLHERTISAIEKLSQLPEKVTVLFIAANPVNLPQLRLDEEVRSITDMVRRSEHRDAVNLVSCWAVRPLDVLHALNEHRPRIIHFSGHGSDQDEIVFQNNDGEAKLVSKEAIVQTLAASGDIQLVFFNTCYSRNQAEAVVKHVPAAIGMNTAIGDLAARTFAAQFYSSIGFGLSVGAAFSQAKAALMLEGIREDATPELFSADGLNPSDLLLVKPENH